VAAGLGELAMLVLFFGVVFPIGMLLRLLGRDALELKKASRSGTSWGPKEQPRGPASYYRQW
jgi:hypothetical protein